MKIKFKKKYKDARGRIYRKGSEEGLTRDRALQLIADGVAEPVIEWEETGIVDKDNNPILKQK